MKLSERQRRIKADNHETETQRKVQTKNWSNRLTDRKKSER